MVQRYCIHLIMAEPNTFICIGSFCIRKNRGEKVDRIRAQDKSIFETIHKVSILLRYSCTLPCGEHIMCGYKHKWGHCATLVVTKRGVREPKPYESASDKRKVYAYTIMW